MSRFNDYRDNRNAAITKELGTDQPPKTRPQFDALFAVKDMALRAQVWELAGQYADRSPRAIRLIAWVLTHVENVASVGVAQLESPAHGDDVASVGVAHGELDEDVASVGVAHGELDEDVASVGVAHNQDVASVGVAHEPEASLPAGFPAFPKFNPHAKVTKPAMPKSLEKKLERDSKPPEFKNTPEELEAIAAARAKGDDPYAF